MSSLVKWTFNAADRTGDVWWKDMNLEAQVLCEKYLQATHRGDSKVHFCHRQILYAIDLARMTQQNLTTGKLRHIQQIEVKFIRSNRQSSPMREIPEAAPAADHSFREAEIFIDRATENRWRSGIEEPSRKRQTYRR